MNNPSPARVRGTLQNVTVCAPPDFFANNPQVIRTDREVVLAYGLQEIDKLRSIKTHQHYQPVSTLVWSITRDGGRTWMTTDLAPTLGPILHCSYGVPTRDGGMVTMSFVRPFLTPYAFIQQGNVGQRPYTNQLPHTGAVPLTDFGPFEGFYFHSMIRVSDGSLLAAGYYHLPGNDPAYCTTVFLRSQDDGRSWRYGSHIPYPSKEFGFSETGLITAQDGRVICIMRTDWDITPVAKRPADFQVGYGGLLYQTESLDHGITWSTPRQLPIWGHPPHLLRLQSGAILMVYGHRRPPYSVRAVLSHDDGKTWDTKSIRTLRTFDPGAYDMGYPQATQLDDGTILCAYYGYSQGHADASTILTLSPCGIFAAIFDEEWMGKTEVK